MKLELNQEAKQLIENVDSVLKSIRHFYNIPHIEQLNNGEHAFSFGAHPIKEHHVTFSPFNGGKAELRISYINSDFAKKITGLTPKQLGEKEDDLRRKEGNNTANTFQNTFKDTLDGFFESNAVRLAIDSYNKRIAFIVDIRVLDESVIKDISLILQNCNLLPNSQSTQHYNL